MTTRVTAKPNTFAAVRLASMDVGETQRKKSTPRLEKLRQDDFIMAHVFHYASHPTGQLLTL